MKVDVLLGLQWGDEGKGKVVDVLTPRYDVVARFQGGPNAGHTLEFEGQKYVLRSIPSGIFQGDKVNIIGNGVVLDPALFKAEAESLEASGHNLKERLHISKKAHLILPTHRILDAAYEAAKGDAKVGTTGKGIGPTYTDKISRNGVRVGDILHDFDKKYAAAKARHEQILKGLNYEYGNCRTRSRRTNFSRSHSILSYPAATVPAPTVHCYCCLDCRRQRIGTFGTYGTFYRTAITNVSAANFYKRFVL